MHLPPPPEMIEDNQLVELTPIEPEPRKRTAATRPARRGVGFDTSDWRNWAVLCGGIAMAAGGVVRAMADIGRPALDIDGIGKVSPAEGLQMAAGATFFGMLLFVLLPACVMALIRRASKGMLATAARTLIAAFVVLLGGTSLAGAALRPRTASAAPNPPQPAVSPAQVMLNWENAHQRKVNQPTGTAEERHAEAVKQLSLHVDKISAPIVKQAEEFGKLGGLAPSTFTDSKSLEARIQLLRRAHETGEEALRLTRALPQKASVLADELGMSNTESTSLIREMTGDGTVDRMVKVRELDCRLFDLLESYLSMIRSNRSKWEVENGKLTFTDAAFAQKVGTVGLEVQRVTREQERLEGEIRGGAKAK